jgi:hypothetical protein
MAKNHFSGKTEKIMQRILFDALNDLFLGGIQDQDADYRPSSGPYGQYRCALHGEIDGSLSVYLHSRVPGENAEGIAIFALKLGKRQAKVIAFSQGKRFHGPKGRTARLALNAAALESLICLLKSGYCFRLIR